MGGPIFTDLVVKSMGKRGEREKVAEADAHLAKNTMTTRKTNTIQGRLLSLVATDPIESSQGKIGQRAPVNPKRRGKNTLERVLTSWQRDTDAKALYNEGGAMQTPTRW